MSPPTTGVDCRPMGDRALLLDLTGAIADAGVDGAALPAAVASALRELMQPAGDDRPGDDRPSDDRPSDNRPRDDRPGDDRLSDVVPAAATVLVRFPSGPGTRPPRSGAAERIVGRAAAAIAAVGRADGAATTDIGENELLVPVRYDGPDLVDVAAATGLTVDQVIAAHTGSVWTAAFVGFAPGFAYLTGGDPRLRVPRRAQSRPSIPAGSVALAGEYSAVYPQQSPGGWQLIGTTHLALWDEAAEPPARIRPGQRVRFVDRAESGSPGTDLSNPDPARGPARVGGPPSAGRLALTVVRPGPLALLQDDGRVGRAADGVGPSGAADRVAHVRANRLVGNDPTAAVIECTLGGLTVRAETDLVVALTGAPATATVDGAPVPHDAAVVLPAGATLRLRAPRTGLRSYLAVAGGLVGRSVLGSTSTDTLARLGPDPLAAGDQLAVNGEINCTPGTVDAQARPGTLDPAAEPAGPTDGIAVLAVRFGSRDDWFADPTALLRGEWVVSPQSNRVGLRLDRPPGGNDGQAPALIRSRAQELPSEGLVRGAVQVPPSGQPVLFLADHPLTGGYPVVAVVLDADVDRAAQLRPGQRLRFVLDDGSSKG